MNQQEWNIKEPCAECKACHRAFADKEPIWSRLTFGAEGYERQDCCAVCWPGAQKGDSVSAWKSVYHMPAPPPPEPIKRETAESLLRQFMETEDPSRRSAIFILAVMLERRRLLVERDVKTREDGLKVRFYEHRKTGEVFVVPDPGLRLDELEQVQQEVIALLGGPVPEKASDKKEKPSFDESRGDGPLGS
ncbi:MAG TPA: hypothetical protein P5567_13930 [Kiritimatiellia bacterium]|nr:hypothetical protein [Kiritimatiellia bacterium]HRZ13541.1 hypothetical protein [Kiritimatiellia bacterium]HSA19154.1 hypothetical protein [Kiritimatiellia bacterium]